MTSTEELAKAHELYHPIGCPCPSPGKAITAEDLVRMARDDALEDAARLVRVLSPDITVPPGIVHSKPSGAALVGAIRGLKGAK